MNIEVLAVAVPVITLIVNGIKGMGVPSKLSPLIAMLIGVGVVMLMTNSHSGQAILIGIITGLSSVGTYESVKTVKKAITSDHS